MALVARDEMGIDPRSLGIRLLGTHLGMENRKPIEDLWNAIRGAAFAAPDPDAETPERRGNDGR
jgi:hypothetical protein